MVRQNYAIASATGKPGWFNVGKSIAHSFGKGAENVEVRGWGINKGRQAVYDSVGNLVTSPENMGTYDFGTPLTQSHYILDIQPWLAWENSPQDTTNYLERGGSVSHTGLEFFFGQY
ncbi:hypothetical protein KJ951_03520 [Patescibacteria group bacterium]|nr:hypothetical protein [Patescibacteria group bacterium]MBU1703447.1 hypothetical protein [Patescibacteria group bacterium]